MVPSSGPESRCVWSERCPDRADGGGGAPPPRRVRPRTSSGVTTSRPCPCTSSHSSLAPIPSFGARGGRGRVSPPVPPALPCSSTPRPSMEIPPFQVPPAPHRGVGSSLSSLALRPGDRGAWGWPSVERLARIGIVVMALHRPPPGRAPSGWGSLRTPRFRGWRGTWFALHVILALVGSGAHAGLLGRPPLNLLQFHELKSKRWGRPPHFLPPLATLERLTTVGLRIGFVAMTLPSSPGGPGPGASRGGSSGGTRRSRGPS